MRRIAIRPVVIPLTALIFAALLPFVLDFVAFLGHRIQGDISNDFLKGVMVAAVLTGIIFIFPFPMKDRRNIYIVWGAKVFVTMVIMLGYEWNYGLDAYYYFNESQKPYPDLSRVGFGSGTSNLIYFFWWFENEIFRTASYHSLKIISSFVGMIALYIFYRGLRNYFPKSDTNLFLFIGLFPSLLFWTSILGKDPYNIFGICLTSYGVLSLMSPNRITIFHGLCVAAGLLVVSFFRVWMVAALLIPLFFAGVTYIRQAFLRRSIIAICAVALVVSTNPIMSILTQERTAETVQMANNISKSWQRGGSAGNVPEFQSAGAMLRYLPIGMGTAVFRPVLGEIMNPFGIVAGIENTYLLYLLFLAFKNRRSSLIRDPINTWLLGYILFWAVLYAFVSPQNLGAAVRFKAQILPALLILLLRQSGYFKLLAVSSRKPRTDSRFQPDRSDSY